MTAIARLTAAIGDADDAAGPLSWHESARVDRCETFPDQACALLDNAGLAAHYVPAIHGGALIRYDELIALWRMVARRDLTVAIAHGKTYLGAVSVWLAGDRGQASYLADRIINGAVVAWGLTEPEHGADLLAGELTAEAQEPAGSRGASGNWRLTGEKWLINNATRADLICVLARTDAAGGPRGFSLFLVEPAHLTPAACRTTPKVRTHGIRGADISGIVFTDAVVPARALVGRPGDGLEIVLKSLQVTRVCCLALSLGAADHALELATRYAAGRVLYGRKLIDLPHVRCTIGEAAAALLTAEATAIVAARSVHALTGELSLISAVTKALVPELIDEMIGRVTELLGVRAFVDELYAEGAAGKLERDHRIVGIFDGSGAVNRSALIGQFPVLARAFAAGRRDVSGLSAAATLTSPLPEFAPGDLDLISASGCSLVQSIPDAVRELNERAARGAVPAAVATLADRVLEHATRLHAGLAKTRPVRRAPASAFHLASRYELCFAAAACMRLWLGNDALASDRLWQDAAWLRACLAYLVARLEPGEPPWQCYEPLASVLADGGQCTLVNSWVRAS